VEEEEKEDQQPVNKSKMSYAERIQQMKNNIIAKKMASKRKKEEVDDNG
jgi:hypothetical protein